MSKSLSNSQQWTVWTEHQRTRHGFVQIEFKSPLGFLYDSDSLNTFDNTRSVEKRNHRRRPGYRTKAYINIKQFWIYKKSIQILLVDYSLYGAKFTIAGKKIGKLNLNKGEKLSLRLSLAHNWFTITCEIVHKSIKQDTIQVGVKFINPKSFQYIFLKGKHHV
ncbi:PilZ domain-containing protein [sulfur-oxidizing endosymbiont of Gigantopelta aegis]|uniref:PilZ domain-containing protein n=1 Tax=sulfur-oxidizing endosymbiont of Gigantopelta aegis TaxID=2794934 RepID=UPI0018DB8B55|nr:PilZ domain-containing protein [sulfur-oxidizing endosymbiont of Gigantopelta aegis]